jgi:tRNA pseudouridine38-40 synthase
VSHETVALTVAYNGAEFAGFARQPGLRTVQGELESALGTLLRRDVEVVGAGRTDAGVHALGQVVSLAAEGTEPDDGSLLRSLNALTGGDLAVSAARRAREGFSARFDATHREYRFRFATGPVPPVLTSGYTWWVKTDLDTEAMRAGSAELVGEHDFRSFCVTESAEGRPTVRRIDEIAFERASDLGEPAVVMTVVGNAFLHSMVRVIAGTLAEVGQARRAAESVGDALRARERAAAGPTAPPHGLMLWRVTYPADSWL